MSAVNLSALPLPDNDNFEDAIPLGEDTLVGYNFTATLEAGEPHSSFTNTVWWSWTAPNSGLACIVTDGSSFDCGIGVYTGNTVSDLTLVANTSDEPTNNTPNYLMFPAVKGATSYIQVAGGYGLPSSDIVISAQPEGMTITDLQTDLDTNTDLLGFSASVEVANAGLSPQNIELDIVARAGYSWTQDASSNGVDFYLPEGLPQDQVLGSYQVANLAPGAQNSLIISNVCPAPKIIDSENFDTDGTFLLSSREPIKTVFFSVPGLGQMLADLMGRAAELLALIPAAAVAVPSSWFPRPSMARPR